MNALLGALTGIGVALGIVLLITGLRPRPARTRRPKRSLKVRWAKLTRRPTGRAGKRRDQLLLASVIVGIILWLVTGWVLALVIAPAAIFGLPWLLRSPDTGVLDRLTAMEQWARNLKGLLAAGNSLESAISSSLGSAPAPIRTEVRDLVSRLSARIPTREALLRFADDLNDSTGDLLAAALVIGAQQRGQGLVGVLEGLASTISDDVKARRSREAARAKPRATARYITLITAGGIAIGALFNDSYVAPYRTALGQIILGVLLSSYVGCLIWMRKIASTPPMPRVLTAYDAEEQRPGGTNRDQSAVAA
ncbi:type II secretion system F family protein [Kribbella sp. NPDC059898]|uniref:type II secretion system F family protein n=1 Tax=Kribbella sp. NPDC059898 TaxID=3346995 RepID=UPI0036468701